jgi:alpha-galactosidase
MQTANGLVLDITHPYTLENAENVARTIRGWGFDLIKHDFSTLDFFGWGNLTPSYMSTTLTKGDRICFDKSITAATAIKNLYLAIQKGAGDADIIGCNTISHITAGIHSCYRVSGDTSGRSWEWSRRNGVNAMMRLPQNENFYLVDPDCAAFTDRVDPDLNLDFLEMCALTGVTTLASVTPNILTDKQMQRINQIYKIADENKSRHTIKYYDRTSEPEVFVSADGKEEKVYDWESAYDGARTEISWLN